METLRVPGVVKNKISKSLLHLTRQVLVIPFRLFVLSSADVWRAECFSILIVLMGAESGAELRMCVVVVQAIGTTCRRTEESEVDMLRTKLYCSLEIHWDPLWDPFGSYTLIYFAVICHNTPPAGKHAEIHNTG